MSVRPLPSTGSLLFVMGLICSFLLTGVLTTVHSQRAEASLKVINLRTEYQENPFGIDALWPRLSWQIQAPGRGVVQAASQVRVARSERDLRAGVNLLWDSNRVNSDQSVH